MHTLPVNDLRARLGEVLLTVYAVHQLPLRRRSAGALPRARGTHLVNQQDTVRRAHSRSQQDA